MRSVQFRIAKVNKLDVLCSYNGCEPFENCEWFIVPTKGSLALHSSLNPDDIQADELEPTSRNRRKLINQGEAFPINDSQKMKQLKKKKSNHATAQSDETLFEERDGYRKYCIAGHSYQSEILFMPLEKMNEIMHPNQDVSFNVEACRHLAKIPSHRRTASDLNKLVTYVGEACERAVQTPAGPPWNPSNTRRGNHMV